MDKLHNIKKRLFLSLLLMFSIQCIFAISKGIPQTIGIVNGKRYIVEKADRYALNERVLLVKLRDGVLIPEGLKIVNSNKLGFLYVSVPETLDVVEYADKLKQSDDYEIVEFLGECKCLFSPNDSNISSQWHINRIKLNDAWNLTTGNPSIKVAVIDTGVDAGHFDLGYGNDSYSHVSTTLGYDYTNFGSYHTPVFYHGTFVAGILGAKTNNFIGVAGVSGGNYTSGVTIIPYCMGNSASFYTAYNANAILDAVDKGVDVINISMSMPTTSDVISALEYAYFHNINIVCSAGNSNTYGIVFPASNQYTIAVGATGKNDMRCVFSNYGPGIDLVAPGDTIYSTTLGNGYISGSGTSFSAPQVSGVIALMLSVNPNLLPGEIRSILRRTAEKISGYTYDVNGWNQEVGYGRLDAFAALIDAFQIEISGADMVCSQELYEISGMPYNDNNVTLNTDSASTDFSIMVSPTLSIVSYSNRELTIQKVSNGKGFIKVYYKGNLIKTKDIWVGAPVINNVYYYANTVHIETDPESCTHYNSYYIKNGSTTYNLPGGIWNQYIPNGKYSIEAYASNDCGESDHYFANVYITNVYGYSLANLSGSGQVLITRKGQSGENLQENPFMLEKTKFVTYTLTDVASGEIVDRGKMPVEGGIINIGFDKKGFYILTLFPKDASKVSFHLFIK